MKKYIKNSNSVSGRLQDEQVILDIEKGNYFSLNPVATKIWDILEKPLTTEEVCVKLLEEYNVESDKCKTETNTYIEEMIKLGLVQEVK
ncbi:PqqD family protein [Aequorivita sinensis]|uniref:PqqD family protein n=1 Tax=Aequorivita sinensis TaxID=1382458 RepID=UPI0022FFEEE2|nr:PqqD family protein [Aequorivita sinensis]